MNNVKILQQQLAYKQSSSVATPTSQTSSSASATTGEAITETALSSEPLIFSYTWNKDLYYGMKNDEDVKALQRVLIKEGLYFGEVTGNFLGLTKKAVVDFQKKQKFTNIPGTGYVGALTRKVLNSYYSK